PEDAAYKRMRVARLGRDVPVGLEHLADGRLHLSGAVVLAPLLTTGDAAALLAQAAGRSKRELEPLVAALAPQPSPATPVRRLPQPATAVSVPPGLALDGASSRQVRASAAGFSPRGESIVRRHADSAPRDVAEGPAASPRAEAVTDVDRLPISPRGE